MAAILIPKFNKSALSISAYLLEAGAVTVNGEVLEWQARKGIQVTHCSLTGQWISAGLTPISFMGCNISLFALEMLLDIMLRNSGVAFHRHDTDPPCWRFTPEERTNHQDAALWLCQRVVVSRFCVLSWNNAQFMCEGGQAPLCLRVRAIFILSSSHCVCWCRAFTRGSLGLSERRACSNLIRWCRWCLTILKCLMKPQPEARCWNPH